MSVNLSVSDNNNNGCKNIIEKLKKCKIDWRLIETNSIVDGNIEKGCLITLGEKWNSKTNLNYFWNLIKKDYTCAHLDIPGKYNGCILNYLSPSICGGNDKFSDKFETLLTICTTP